MVQGLDRRKAELVKKIVAKARSRGGKGGNEPIERFVRLYYEHVPPRDMVDQAPKDLSGAALAHCRAPDIRNKNRMN